MELIDRVCSSNIGVDWIWRYSWAFWRWTWGSRVAVLCFLAYLVVSLALLSVVHCAALDCRINHVRSSLHAHLTTLISPLPVFCFFCLLFPISYKHCLGKRAIIVIVSLEIFVWLARYCTAL